MASPSTFLILVFFISGLAFFIMGFAVALESRRASGFPLAASLKYLAAFGLIHSLVEWMDMFLLILAEAPPVNGLFSLKLARTVFLAGSTVLLIQFAVKLIVDTQQRRRWLRWMPTSIFTIWLLSFVIPHLGVAETTPVSITGPCLQCHWGQAATYVTVGQEWLTSADIWARYILYFSGSLLAALAMMTQRTFFQALGLRAITRYCAWAAAAFAFNAVIAGLIVPPGNYPPASIINYATFFSLVGIPPQIFRAAIALAVAILIIRVLGVFGTERQRQLEQANQGRFEAQQQLLEAQRLARDQLEEWNRELEARVQQRTREIEQRDNQLVILEERDRIATEMHDSQGQIMGYLNLQIIRLKQLLAEARTEATLEALGQIEKAIEDATADVREAILGLRTRLSPEVGLVPTLEEYLTKFGEQTGLRTETSVNGDLKAALTPVREVQLLRIVQEALTNVRKHAQASQVKLRIEAQKEAAVISVEDDGRGFDLAQVSQQRGHFGLQIMKERAQGIGGDLVINTSPGQGTKVAVKLPWRAEEG